MTGTWRAKPIRLAATMSVPGIQSPLATTRIPKTSAASSPTVRSAVTRTCRLNSSLAVTVGLLFVDPPFILPGDGRAVISRIPRDRSAQWCRALANRAVPLAWCGASSVRARGGRERLLGTSACAVERRLVRNAGGWPAGQSRPRLAVVSGSTHAPLIRKLDCLQLPVGDLEAGVAFYERLGHEV